MAQPQPITNFSAGELSPRMRGRFDTEIYTKGIEYGKNYIPLPFGGITRRPGTHRLHDITSELAGAEPLLVPVPSNTTDDIMLVVWQTGGNIKIKPIIFSTVPTVGTTQSLSNTYVGAVSRKTKWAISEDGTKVSFADTNIRPFTASFDGPTTDDWTIAWTAFDAPEWDAEEYYNPGDIVKDTTYFIAIDNTEDEPNLDKATSLTAYWTAYNGPKTPGFAVKADAESTDTLASPWYPSCVVVHDGRVVYGGSIKEPSAIWGSKVRDPLFFVIGINDNAPYKHTLASSDSGRIHWMLSGEKLVVGAEGGEFVITGGALGITPTSVSVTTKTSFGSDENQALLFNEQVIFAQADSQQLRAYSYIDKLASFYAAHINAPADHIYKNLLKSWTLIRTPRTVVLGVDGNGDIVQFDYNRELQQTAFTKWMPENSGDEFVSVGALSSLGKPEDLVVVVAKRDSDYFIELCHWVDYPYHTTAPMGSSYTYTYGMYLDSATEVAITSDVDGYLISGLTDYEGREISIVIDGAPHPPQTVTSGVVRVDFTGTEAYVGYNYESAFQTMNLNPAIVTKRLNQFIIRVVDSVGAKIGPSYDELETIIFRDGVTYYDTALPLFTGDKIVDNVGGFDRDAHIWVVQSDPLPQTILMIAPWTERYE